MEQAKLQTIEISRIIKVSDYNYNKDTFVDARIENLMKTYKEGVPLPPITVRKCSENHENYEIVSGKHRFMAMKQLNMQKYRLLPKSIAAFQGVSQATDQPRSLL